MSDEKLLALQAEDGIRDSVASRGLGDVYKRQLADTMSRLIQIDPETKLNPEPEGYEFGYHAFEDMEPINVMFRKLRFQQKKIQSLYLKKR